MLHLSNTETAAYRNLLSGSLPVTRQPQVQDDDTDENSENEMEKHFMSTFTPRSQARYKPLFSFYTYISYIYLHTPDYWPIRYVL